MKKVVWIKRMAAGAAGMWLLAAMRLWCPGPARCRRGCTPGSRAWAA